MLRTAAVTAEPQSLAISELERIQTWRDTLKQWSDANPAGCARHSDVDSRLHIVFVIPAGEPPFTTPQNLKKQISSTTDELTPAPSTDSLSLQKKAAKSWTKKTCQWVLQLDATNVFDCMRTVRQL
jgi:hypothetical protein